MSDLSLSFCPVLFFSTSPSLSAIEKSTLNASRNCRMWYSNTFSLLFNIKFTVKMYTDVLCNDVINGGTMVCSGFCLSKPSYFFFFFIILFVYSSCYFHSRSQRFTFRLYACSCHWFSQAPPFKVLIPNVYICVVHIKLVMVLPSLLYFN